MKKPFNLNCKNLEVKRITNTTFLQVLGDGWFCVTCDGYFLEPIHIDNNPLVTYKDLTYKVYSSEAYGISYHYNIIIFGPETVL